MTIDGKAKTDASIFYVPVVFGLSGMLSGGLIQADLPALERAFELDHETITLRLAAFSLLSGISGFVAGLVADRIGAGRVFRFSILAAGLGLLLFATLANGLVALGFVLAGIGIGGLVTGNTLTAESGLDRPNRAMNLLHAAHGAARLAAIPVSIASLAVGWQTSYALLGLLFLLLAGRRPPAPAARRQGCDDERHPFFFGSPAENRFLLAVLAGFFFYILAEIALVTWITAWFEKDRGWDPTRARVAYGVFLVGLIGGRLLAARRWPVLPPARAAAALTGLHLLAITLLVKAPDGTTALIALFLLGFAQGPGWTALFALAARRIGARTGRLTSFIFVTTSLGIVAATAGSGQLAHRFGIEAVFPVVGLAHLVFGAVQIKLLTGKMQVAVFGRIHPAEEIDSP